MFMFGEDFYKNLFDVSNKTKESTKVYNEVFEFWKELGEEMPLDTPEKIKKYSERGETVIANTVQNMFEPMLPEPMKELLGSVLNLYKKRNNTILNFMDPWVKNTEEYKDWLGRMTKGDTKVYNEFLNSAYEAYKESFGRAFNVAGIGINREQQEEQFHTLDAYMKLIFSYTEMMTLIMEIGQKTSKDIILKYNEMVQSSTEKTDFKDFYNLWIEKNEEAFENIFATEEFSKLFGEFSANASDFKAKYDAILEQIISFYPVPTNTEMKGLYKTVYDLRKEVSSLKKEVGRLSDVK